MKQKPPFLLFLLFLILSTPVFPQKNIQPLDNLVAIVNDSVVTQSELNDSMQKTKKQLQAGNISLPPPDVFRKQVLDQLINKKLQLQMAEQTGIKIAEPDVQKAIQSIAKDHQLSVTELYARVAEQGMSASEYRKEIREQMTLQKLQQQALGPKMVVTPQEVNDFMRSKTWQAYNTKEYHLEDILVALPETPTKEQIATAKKRAEALLARIRHGLPFQEAVAAGSSENTTLQGGDLGWRKLPEIPTAFSNEIIQMKVNDVAGPIQTANGFHLIKLTGVKSAAQTLTPEQQKKQVEQLIFQRKLEEALQRWIAKLRSDSYIRIEGKK